MFILSLLTSDLAAGFCSQWMQEEEQIKTRDPILSYFNAWTNLEKQLQDTFKDSAVTYQNGVKSHAMKLNQGNGTNQATVATGCQTGM